MSQIVFSFSLQVVQTKFDWFYVLMFTLNLLFWDRSDTTLFSYIWYLWVNECFTRSLLCLLRDWFELLLSSIVHHVSLKLYSGFSNRTWRLMLQLCIFAVLFRYGRKWQEHLHQTDEDHSWCWVLGWGQKRLHPACLPKHLHLHAVHDSCHWDAEDSL